MTLTRCKSMKSYSQNCSGGGCGDGAGSGGCCASKKSNGATGPTREEVERELCYSCRLTVSSMKTSVPEFLLVESGKRATTVTGQGALEMSTVASGCRIVTERGRAGLNLSKKAKSRHSVDTKPS